MVLIVLLVLLLLMVQAFLPAKYLGDQVGPQQQMGPRDDLPPPTPELKRARNALSNLQETLPTFLTLAVLGIVLEAVTIVSLVGALVYLLARVAHVFCYLRALSPWRSYAFGVSLLGLLAMVFPLLWHLP